MVVEKRLEVEVSAPVVGMIVLVAGEIVPVVVEK